jgi:hypothetical protein
MYSLTISPAVAMTVAEQQTRDAVQHSRLARAAQFAREGRGEPEVPTRHQIQPRHRSRLVWLFGMRSNAAR